MESCEVKPLEVHSKVGEYEILEVLSSRSNKVMYKAKSRSTTVIIKQINYRSHYNAYFSKLRDIAHPNLVRVLSCFESFSSLFIVFEYLAEGDLKTTIDKHGVLSEGKALFILQQLLKGYQTLTQYLLLHHNISPNNVLFELSPAMNWKLGDYGIEKASVNSDASSFGVLLYFMLHGNTDYSTGYSSGLSKECVHFLDVTLNKDYAREITIEQLCIHPFITERAEKPCQCKISRPISLACKHALCLICAGKYMEAKKYEKGVNPWIQPRKIQCKECKMFTQITKIKLECGCLVDRKIKARNGVYRTRFEVNSKLFDYQQSQIEILPSVCTVHKAQLSLEENLACFGGNKLVVYGITQKEEMAKIVGQIFATATTLTSLKISMVILVELDLQEDVKYTSFVLKEY
eukprot:TRINITY_DN1737_c0_g1_i1.p1 TRINITY_DN1737_c0_g1~~TRINITY_DN1737_c0_g1_i1.p1  ORF type:complete len:430 (+),score=30.93 TRINITY_DN1737_c0_g1_i1:81-1292(+)